MGVEYTFIIETDYEHRMLINTTRPHFKKILTRGTANILLMDTRMWKYYKDIDFDFKIEIVVVDLIEPKEAVRHFSSLDLFHNYLRLNNFDNVCVVGSKELFEEIMEDFPEYLHTIHHTTIYNFIPSRTVGLFDWKSHNAQFCRLLFKTSSKEFSFDVVKTETVMYHQEHRHMTDEKHYLRLLQDVLDEGEHRGDRTGVGTISLFSPSELRYDLRNNILPIFTSKKVVWKKGIMELLWYINGGTSSKQLEEVGVNYWKGNSTRDFLDKRGLAHYQEGELGPVYGWQWRRWGAQYPNEEGGVDQLKGIIDEIRTNPTSRRLIISAWNVGDLEKMALPPCHMMAQFYVSGGEYLDCKLYQRSADLFLGVPLNVLCYALLTHMIAHITNLTPRYFIHSFGDAHIYANHVEQVRKQLGRSTFPFPTLRFKRTIDEIDDFTFDDFVVEGYQCHPGIRAPMAV